MVIHNSNDLARYDPDNVDIGSKIFAGQFDTASSFGAKRAAFAFQPLLFQFQSNNFQVLRCGIVGFPSSGKTRFAEGLLEGLEEIKALQTLHKRFIGPSGLIVRHYDTENNSREIDYHPTGLVEEFEAEARPRVDVVEHPHLDQSQDRSIQLLWKLKTIPDAKRRIQCYAEPELAKSEIMRGFFANIDAHMS